MSVPIRIGFHTKNPEKITSLKKLQKLHIIEIAEKSFQYCKNGCVIPIDETFIKEGLKSCPICTASARLSLKPIIEYKIVKINHETIIKILNKILKNTGKKVLFDKHRHCWIYNLKTTQIPVLISDVSSQNQFINNQSDLCWLCIIIDWEANKDILNDYNSLNFLPIEEVIHDRVNIHERLEIIGTKFNTNRSIELEKKFNEYIRPISGTAFESEFIDAFWKAIKEKEVALERYLRFLSEHNSTIINSKVVFMGYAANPDFAVLNLREYLQEALKPNKIGEAKRYRCDNLHSTQFTWEEFSVGLAHADDADALFILSTNDIAPSVWRRVVEKHQSLKRFKIVIIDKDLILLLIEVLRLEDLLSKPLTPAKARQLEEQEANNA